MYQRMIFIEFIQYDGMAEGFRTLFAFQYFSIYFTRARITRNVLLLQPESKPVFFISQYRAIYYYLLFFNVIYIVTRFTRARAI